MKPFGLFVVRNIEFEFFFSCCVRIVGGINMLVQLLFRELVLSPVAFETRLVLISNPRILLDATIGERYPNC